METQFKEGMKVKHLLHGAGYITEEEYTVYEVDENGGVWLDCGEGNDPIGPFVNRKMPGVFGFWAEIVPIT